MRMRAASSKSERKNPVSAHFCGWDKFVARSRKRARWLAMYSATDAETWLICSGERLGEGIVKPLCLRSTLEGWGTANADLGRPTQIKGQSQPLTGLHKRMRMR